LTRLKPAEEMGSLSNYDTFIEGSKRNPSLKNLRFSSK